MELNPPTPTPQGWAKHSDLFPNNRVGKGEMVPLWVLLQVPLQTWEILAQPREGSHHQGCHINIMYSLIKVTGMGLHLCGLHSEPRVPIFNLQDLRQTRFSGSLTSPPQDCGGSEKQGDPEILSQI